MKTFGGNSGCWRCACPMTTPFRQQKVGTHGSGHSSNYNGSRLENYLKLTPLVPQSAAADTTVTQVATHWGFLHLGEFARDYQRLFGERPSETLGRSGSRNWVG